LFSVDALTLVKLQDVMEGPALNGTVLQQVHKNPLKSIGSNR